ncbi:MAG: hypothetical protein KH292_03505, partial [Collinsella sp.]|nr:hypothetical protein [Collinsella sp.]
RPRHSEKSVQQNGDAGSVHNKVARCRNLPLKLRWNIESIWLLWCDLVRISPQLRGGMWG